MTATAVKQKTRRRHCLSRRNLGRRRYCHRCARGRRQRPGAAAWRRRFCLHLKHRQRFQPSRGGSRRGRAVPGWRRQPALRICILGGSSVPVGLGLLQDLPASTCAVGPGLLLILYRACVLLKSDSLRIELSDRRPTIAVGAAGGISSRFPALAGSGPVLDLGLHGVSKVVNFKA